MPGNTVTVTAQHMSLEAITFWGIVGGVAAGSVVSFILWLIQHGVEAYEKGKDDLNRRFNYINDLIIECEENIKIIKTFNFDPTKNSIFSGYEVGNIAKFEKNYHSNFLFSKDTREHFKTLREHIWYFRKPDIIGSSLVDIDYLRLVDMNISLKASQIELLNEFKNLLEETKQHGYNFDFKYALPVIKEAKNEKIQETNKSDDKKPNT